MGRRTEGTGGTNRGGATAHGTRRRERRERMERMGRVGNPPYGTTMPREGWLLILTVLAHGKLKQIIFLKLIEGTTPRKGAKALSVFK